jgi:signal transduction histidine kinase
MLGLRTKLALGFGGLLAVLLILGGYAIHLLSRLGGSIDVILRENYRSVIACEDMKEALERLDSGALFALAGHPEEGAALAAAHGPRFGEALAVELGNITLPGEGERAERLRELYGLYWTTLGQVLDTGQPLAKRRQVYFEHLLPRFRELKRVADEILRMNQEAMAAANDSARSLAGEARRRMVLLLVLGAALAAGCVGYLSRAILGPLKRLTASAREIERGNLDVVVKAEGRDEIGRLAIAFNEMTGRLRELRRSDRARLLRTQEISQLAMDSLPDAVVLFSPDLEVELTNRSATSLLGLVPGEPISEPHAPWLLRTLKEAQRSRAGTPLGLDAAVPLPHEGGERYFLPRAVVVRDERREMVGITLVLSDVTEMRRGRQREIAQDRRERTADPAHRDRPRERLEAAELIRPAAEELRRSFDDAGVGLAVEVDPDTPEVEAEPERIRFVLQSLLANAREATPSGGAVTVVAKLREGQAEISVTDTGRGIPAEYLDRIFERFFQVPGTEGRGGAGLGLSIARDIVREHGGEMSCESREGSGSTFRFTLPAAS